jgi:adenylate kinase
MGALSGAKAKGRLSVMRGRVVQRWMTGGVAVEVDEKAERLGEKAERLGEKAERVRVSEAGMMGVEGERVWGEKAPGWDGLMGRLAGGAGAVTDGSQKVDGSAATLAATQATTATSATAAATLATSASPESVTKINDPVLIFQRVWDKLLKKHGAEHMCFPREIIFLMGAPGSGKGTNTPFILRERGITAKPLVMSDLLCSPEAEEIKRRAGLVSDFIVVELLLEKLLSPEYQLGVVVDGFPRSNVQVGIVKLLHNQMLELRKQFSNNPTLAYKFPRPIFRVTVLFVDEKVSVDRQLERGHFVREHNEKVATGAIIGEIIPERPTDNSGEAARDRYAVFAQHYDTLETLRSHFTFNIIPATGSIAEVERAIVREFAYQSQLELNEETFNAIHLLPTNSELTLHARQEMLRRLDNYSSQEYEMFQSVVHCLTNEFFPIIKAHSLVGAATVRSQNIVFRRPSAIACAIDILAERGFHAICDIEKVKVPAKFDLETGVIKCEVEKSWIFHISFKRPIVRKD